MPHRRHLPALTLLLASVVATVPAAAQRITHTSLCHPEGSDSYPVGDTIVFTYHPPEDPPILPKLPVTTVPPCIDLTLTAEGVTGRPPLTFTWRTGIGHTWSGNPITVDTGSLPTGIVNLGLRVHNAWGDAFDAINLDVAHLAGPLPAPVPDDAPSPDLTVAFLATAGGAHEWSWDFGDGTTTPWEIPCGFATSTIVHTFPDPGTYSVVAYARNCRDGTVASEPLTISVGDPDAIDLLAFEAQGCSESFCVFPAGAQIDFTVLTNAPPDAYHYDWDGNGTVDQITTSPASHAYPTFGVYSPTLTVHRGTATDTLVHPTLILIN